jgi:hypothetical protein
VQWRAREVSSRVGAYAHQERKMIAASRWLCPALFKERIKFCVMPGVPDVGSCFK